MTADQARQAGARVGGRHRSVGRSLGDEDHRGKHDQGHPEVGGDELGGQPLENDRGAEQRLDDDEDAGDDRGAEQRQVATPMLKTVMRPTAADQRPDEDCGDQPMGVLDPGVEIRRRQPVAEAERPIRTAEPRIGGAHEATHGDQDEGRDGSGNRQLGETGHMRVPLTARWGRASGRGHDSRRIPESGIGQVHRRA